MKIIIKTSTLTIFLLSMFILTADDENTRFDQQVQNLFNDAEVNKNQIFPASNFDSWVCYMTSMDKNVVGTFKFSNRGKWTNKGHYETYISGITVGSGIRKAWDLCYYRYKTRENRWQNSNAFIPFCNNNDKQLLNREKRFLFFKFTGKAAFNTKLDNSMFCVDTYTKFIWYYSEPAVLKNIVGNAVPTEWVDYEYPHLSSDHTQVYNKFYMYDPLGYVTENGDVIMYNWAKLRIKPGNYHPRQYFTTPAQRCPNKPGHSPYLPAGTCLKTK